MNKRYLCLFSGLAAAAITVILYLIIVEDLFLRTITSLTLFGVLIAEAITTALACFANGQPRKVAATFVSSLMIPVSIFLSIVYIVGHPHAYEKYIGIYAACLIVVGIIAIILWSVDSSKKAESDAFQYAKQNMLALRKQVMVMLADPASAPYRKELEAVEEKLHFSEDGVVAAQDAEIQRKLYTLQCNIANPSFDVKASIEDLCLLIDYRNLLCKKSV